MGSTFTQSKHNGAYTFIRRGIITHTFAPEKSISVADIVREAMIDAASVQQSLVSLASENWVTLTPEGDFYICAVTLREVEEIMDMRRVLEPLVIEHAMARLSEKQFAYLEALLAEYERLGAARGMEEQLLETDKSFHLYLTELANNSRLTAFMRTALDMFLRLGVNYAQKQLCTDYCLYEYTTIIEALRKADCPAAKDAVQRHLDRARGAIVAYVRENCA